MSNLGLDYLDLYLIHWPCPERGLFTETYRALETLYREGRVRAIGVSNFQPDHLDRLLENADVVPAVNQIELHPWLQQDELRETHADLGIRTEAWSPLGRGQVLDDPVILALAADHERTRGPDHPALARAARKHRHPQGQLLRPHPGKPGRLRLRLSAPDMAAIAALDRGLRTGSHPTTSTRTRTNETRGTPVLRHAHLQRRT